MDTKSKGRKLSLTVKEKRERQNRLNRVLRFEAKKEAVEYMGGKCNRCGGEFHQAAFDFHHVNPEEKDVDPGSLVRRSKEALYAELSKCILLCANCHRIHHWEEANKDTDFDEKPLPVFGLTVNGVTKTFGEWSAETGIGYETLRARVRDYGWDPERAVTEKAKEGPRQHKEMLTVDGVTKSIREWSLTNGIPVKIIRLRIGVSKWSIKDAVTTPLAKRRKRVIEEENVCLEKK